MTGETQMQLGMIGLGRMGSNMVRRLLRQGHDCVVYDVSTAAVDTLAGEGASGAHSYPDLIRSLSAPRVIWLMVPAGSVDALIGKLAPLLAPGDILVDGGNSNYVDDIRRAGELAAAGIDYVDVGTSGGVWGLERGYCMMIGGSAEAVGKLDPIFAALAPGPGAAPPTPERADSHSTAESGYLHCGNSGAGHFVKMVHNGIEYGLMAAYAEGLGLLRAANAGASNHEVDAETTPLREPAHYRYELPLADVAEVWRRGSVISSWLLDLIAAALARDPELADFGGRVADSGEGRWTVKAAVDVAVPVPVLSAALFERFGSRGGSDFQHRLLSAMRYGFGGHEEKQGGR
jgi:6-phosphogluconate dehydrogenase